MAKRIGITDVAREAEVSIATVSRVVNGGYPVRPETRERVLAAVRKLGFRPNDIARSLLLKKTRTVGLIIPDIANPYYPAITRGVEDTASEHLYAVIFCNADRDEGKSEYYVNTLLGKQVDGIIIAGGGTDYGWASDTFAEVGAEVVFIGRHRPDWPSVQIDNVAAARAATTHLTGLGHRDIAFLAGPLTLSSVHDRLAGYRLGLEDHGLAFDYRLLREGDFTEHTGYEAAIGLLADRPAPTAIFAANDRMAIGAMAAIADRGLRVPDDVSVVGFDDVGMASYVRPALTTVAVPTYELGTTAMRLMLRRLGEEVPDPPGTVTTEPTLTVRDSATDPSESSVGTAPVVVLRSELKRRASAAPLSDARAGNDELAG